MLRIIGNSWKNSLNEAPSLQSGTHRAVFCYLLLFDSLLMVYEGLCGKISIFFRLTDD